MLTFSQSNRTEMSHEDRDALAASSARWGNAPRLSKDEVIALAQAKDAGILASERLQLAAYPTLADALELKKIEAAGLEARNLLVEHNMALVISIARKWVGRGVALEDLIQEGAIGLMRAVDLFDWERGNEFSTYAGTRIIAACQRAIENQAETIRIPVHVRTNKHQQVKDWSERARRVVSGNKEITNKAGVSRANTSTLFDTIPNPGQLSIEDEATNRTAAAAGLAALTDPDQRLVIELHYFGDQTYETIGQQMGLTRQRVEQIKKAAVLVMRKAIVGVDSGN